MSRALLQGFTSVATDTRQVVPSIPIFAANASLPDTNDLIFTMRTKGFRMGWQESQGTGTCHNTGTWWALVSVLSD